MAITKQKKTEILAKLDAGLKDAETITFVNFHGLTVGEVTELRNKLREAGVSYYVAKKTLVKRALDAKGITGTQPELAGELALAWSADPVASPKGVYEFAKTHKDKISLLGGVYQGQYFSKEEITTLASIPSMLGLRGQFVGMLNQSIASFVRVVDARAQKLEAEAA
jgi:large subunit ribosomal protein L10